MKIAMMIKNLNYLKGLRINYTLKDRVIKKQQLVAIIIPKLKHIIDPS